MNRILTFLALSILSGTACQPKDPDFKPSVELRIAAIHQGGHAVFALSHSPTYQVTGMDAAQDGGKFTGHTQVARPGCLDDAEPSCMRLRLAELMAGQVAEEMILGAPSMGSDDDDAKASELAYQVAQASPGESPVEIMRGARAVAKMTLGRRRAAIEAFALVLLQQGRLDQLAIAQVWQQYGFSRS